MTTIVSDRQTNTRRAECGSPQRGWHHTGRRTRAEADGYIVTAPVFLAPCKTCDITGSCLPIGGAITCKVA